MLFRYRYKSKGGLKYHFLFYLLRTSERLRQCQNAWCGAAKNITSKILKFYGWVVNKEIETLIWLYRKLQSVFNSFWGGAVNFTWKISSKGNRRKHKNTTKIDIWHLYFIVYLEDLIIQTCVIFKLRTNMNIEQIGKLNEE